MPYLALLLVLAPQDLVLLAHDGEGFAVAETLAADRWGPTPLPYVTLEERVPRIVPTGRGLGIRLEAHAPCTVQDVHAAAVSHPRGWRVVRTEDGLWVMSPPISSPQDPRFSMERSLVPELARLDLLGFQGGPLVGWNPWEELHESRGEGDWIAAVGVEGGRRGSIVIRHRDEEHRRELRAGPFDATLFYPPSPSFGLTVEPLPLDQLALVTARRLASDPRPLARRALAFAPDVGGAGRVMMRKGRGPATRVWSDLRGKLDGADTRDGAALLDGGLTMTPRGVLEVWFEPPPPAALGSTWSVLVSVEHTSAEGVPRPLGSETPGAAAAALPTQRALGVLVDTGTERGFAFVHQEGAPEQLDIRPTMGPGAAWGDVDGDGWNDLYVLQGEAFANGPTNRLFRNVAGHFEDVTEASGTGDTGAGMGALFFDGDGDGDLDLFVANRGYDWLYQNDGRGVFDRVSPSPGHFDDRWSAGIAAADTDLDGDLDLYVTSYLDYDESKMPAPEELASYDREDPIAMLPFAFPGERNTFWRNVSADGALRFEDATDELGLADELGRGMQPVFWDFDDDGDPDLYVANDVSYNVLFRNEGDGTFRDVSFATGMDDPRGGMGVAIGDVEGDGDEDLFLTNWELEANALYRNNLLSHTSQRSRVATFRDVTVRAGFAPYAVGYTSWGAELGDLDLNGDLDLVVANGYTSPDYESTGICVGQPNLLFLGDGDGHFVERSRELAPALREELPSRCVAACDFDRDGDLDLLITANNAPAQLLENQFERAGRWLVVRLRGAGPNTRAVGARVTVEAGGRTWRRTLRAGTSYLAGNPPEVHFGLGGLDAAETVTVRVRWPDGNETTHADQGLDRYLELTR